MADTVDTTDVTDIIESVSSATEYPFTCVSRASFRKYIGFRNNDIVGLSQLQGLFEIKTSKYADLPIFQGTNLNGIIKFTDLKRFTLEIPGFRTGEFQFEKAYYQLFVTNTAINFTRRLLHGPFYCEQT